MAVTKGKKIRQRMVHRASAKLRSSPAKARHKKAAKGKLDRAKLGPSSKSRSLQVSKARQLVAEHPNQRSGGSWDTQKWLIGKKLAHVVKEKLIADFRNEDSRALGKKAKKQRTRR
jgi:hypothetical protein